jgi:hypothetical protein
MVSTKTTTRPPIADAKRAVVSAILKGDSVAKATAKVGRTVKTYEGWRSTDKDFARQVDEARARRAGASETGLAAAARGDLDIDFATWRKRYLGYETYPHQQQWIDVLEGREPTLIDGCEYVPGNPKRLLINTPPGGSKSTTITTDYVTYRIAMNPNVRIVIISKRIEMARAFLYQIKQRLTSDRFAALQADYAPPGGWEPERGEGAYSQNLIYVRGRTSDHKDPTVEVLGWGSQIYGKRADLIILDDVITVDNAHEYEKQYEKLTKEVQSRLKNGKLLVVGTRLRPVDLYGELMNPDRFNSGRSSWTYLRQPLVLSFADDPKDWKTLWPYSTIPYDEEDVPNADGLYEVFTGPICAGIRADVSPSTWSMVYQQLAVSEDAVFKAEAVYGSMQRGRAPGPLRAGAMHHPPQGGDGMYTIGSVDPAMSEDTFVIVGKADRVSRKRYIENAWVQTAPTPEWIRTIIKRVTDEYGVNIWVIESNAFQKFLTLDTELTRWLADRGVKIVPHYTSRNKADPEFGVASLEPLFGQLTRTNGGAGKLVHVRGSSLIELPDLDRSSGIRALCEQLITWEPGKRGSKLKMDGPMALWFWELRARIHLGVAKDNTKPPQAYARDKFMSDGDKARQFAKPAGFFGATMRAG